MSISDVSDDGEWNVIEQPLEILRVSASFVAVRCAMLRRRRMSARATLSSIASISRLLRCRSAFMQS